MRNIGTGKVSLGDLCTQDRVPAVPNDRLPVLGLDQIESGTGNIAQGQGSKAAAGEGAYFAFNSSHVLYSKLRPYLNKVALPDSTGRCSTELVPLKPAEGVDRRYLAYLLRSNSALDAAVASSSGARMPRTNMDVFLRHQVRKHSLEEQRLIVEILDRASRVLRLREAADGKLAELAPAFFVDMFGTPASNPMGWALKPLKEVSQIGSGITKGRKLDAARTIGVPYLRVANVQDGKLDLTEVKTIAIDVDERDKYALWPGDIVMTEGGDIDKLGRGYVWQGELPYCAHQNHVFRVRVDKSVLEPFFLSTLIGTSHGKSYFLRVAKRTTGIASINKTQLGNLPVWLPPISMQRAFVGRLEALQASQEIAGRAASTIAATAAALSRQVFG